VFFGNFWCFSSGGQNRPFWGFPLDPIFGGFLVFWGILGYRVD
jgi:hypothetical protein